MSVGGTNPSRAGNLTSEASSTENVAGTPPHGTPIWILQHVEKSWALSKLGEVISGRSKSQSRCAASLSTFSDHFFPTGFLPICYCICGQGSFYICPILFSASTEPFNFFCTLFPLDFYWISPNEGSNFSSSCSPEN